MTQTLLIGLTGHAGSGKDTVRQILEGRAGFDGIAFADPVREMLGVLLDNCQIHRSWMSARDRKEDPMPKLGVSYRKLAQTLGTDWGCNMVDSDLWVKVAASRIDQLDEIATNGIVVSDVRYPNEAAMIKQRGGHIWRILRPGVDTVRSHSSEAHIGTLPYDYVIDNRGSIENLIHATLVALDYTSKALA